MQDPIRSFDYDSFEGWQKTAYLILSLLGFPLYMALSLIATFLLTLMGGVLWFWLHTEKKGHHRDPVSALFYLFDRYILQPLWQVFAGLMGWGAQKTKPWMMPLLILGSIPFKLKPNKVCAFLGLVFGGGMSLIGVALLFESLFT
ncbi:MAG: hypothetical protein AAF329_05765 [Cyanobacteria bacterium P01_A01_bin.17]